MTRIANFFRWVDSWIDSPIPMRNVGRLSIAIGFFAALYVVITTGSLVATAGVYLIGTGAAFLNLWIFSKLHNWAARRHKQVDDPPK